MKIVVPFLTPEVNEPALEYAAQLSDSKAAEIEFWNAQPVNGKMVAGSVEQEVADRLKAYSKNGVNFQVNVDRGSIFNLIRKKFSEAYDLAVWVARPDEQVDQTAGSVTASVLDELETDSLVIPEKFKFRNINRALLIGELNAFRDNGLHSVIDKISEVFPGVEVSALNVDNRPLPENDLRSLKDKLSDVNNISPDRFPELVFDKDVIADDCQLVILAFAKKGSLQHKIFIGNLTRRAALHHQKPFFVAIR